MARNNEVRVALGQLEDGLSSESGSPPADVSVPFQHPAVDVASLAETLVLIPTFRCSAECDNCCFASNPRIHDRADQADLLAYISRSTAAFPSLRSLAISGGEPFMLGDDLVELVAAGAAEGLHVRVVTNAYWATTPARSASRLASLIEAGLSELAVSSGDEHVRFVPRRRVVNALVAALDAELPAALSIEATADSTLTVSSFLDAPPLRAALDSATGSNTLRTFSSPWMQVLDGPVAAPAAALTDRATLDDEPGCEVVLRTAVINPTGHLGVCDGLIRELVPELRGPAIGDHDLGQLFAEQGSQLLPVWLMLDGPKRILRWAAGHDPTIEWEGRYAHNCDACRQVFEDPRVRGLIAQNHPNVSRSLTARLNQISR